MRSTMKPSCTVMLCMMVGVGCTTTHYKKAADTEVYRIIAAKTPAVTNMPRDFSIERTVYGSLDDCAAYWLGTGHRRAAGLPDRKHQASP